MRIVGTTTRDLVETQPSEGPPVSLSDAQNVGALLREARERRGFSLDRLAQLTRIRPSLLGAIESNDISAVPQAIFLRGFLRAYAREVGLDPEVTVRCYLDQFEQPDEAVGNPTASVQNPDPGAQPEMNWRALGNIAGVTVITVLVMLYGIGRWHTKPVAPSPAPAAVSRAPEAHPEVGTAGSAATTAVGAAGHVLHVALRTTGDCWVSATVDGTQVVYKLLPPDDARAFDVKDEIVLHLGDPAAASLSIDGAAARPLGTAGVPATVRITKDNFRDYLRR